MYRVVLVDDEQIILQGLQRAFPWAEYDCEVAGVAMDGQEGLKLIREVKPDLLLTDICMPNMDGLTMIAALKSAFPAMQVAVLTAYRDFDYAQKALNLGVCRYLLKPSNMEQLREAISTMKARLDEAPPAPSALEPEAEPAERRRFKYERKKNKGGYVDVAVISVLFYYAGVCKDEFRRGRNL